MRFMQRKSRSSARLFSGFDTLQFAGVMGMVVFVVLLIFMTVPTHPHHGVGADLPQVLHPVAMPGADREDAMKVMIMRDGSIYFGTDKIYYGDLPAKIQERLKDRDVERKVYIVADMRARWSSVEMALDGVRSAGIVRVAFMTEMRRMPSYTR
jgi:biopolymer transport protein ExbD